MVGYIQKSNRNAFTLRFRKYKNLRYDLWGRIFVYIIFIFICFLYINNIENIIMFFPYYKKNLILTKKIKFNYILKRTMFSRFQNIGTKTTNTLTTGLTKPITSKNMGSMHVGKFKHLRPTLTDKGTPIKSDVSGDHDIVIAAVCSEKGCSQTNCADSTKTTTNPCQISTGNHKKPIDTNTKPLGISYILAGNTTHKIPKGKKGVIIDGSRDIKGTAKSQSMVAEKDKTTIDTTKTQFIENGKSTQFFQENGHTLVVLNSLANDVNIK